MIRSILTLLAAALIITFVAADDWPQWRGPNRDGISKEKGLLKKWPAGGPKLLWTSKEGGIGYSAPSIVGDTLYCLGAWDGEEHVYAMNVKDGKRKWATKLGPMFDWKGNNWNAGPSASPTVDGDLIFALSGNGELVCVDKTGKEKWRKNMTKDLGGEVNSIGGGPEKLGWGWTWSPLVDGDKLIIVPGGNNGLLAALDKKTGNQLWRSKGTPGSAAYSSPILATVGGVKMYVIMNNDGVYGIDDEGKQLWFFEKKGDDVVIPTPVFSKDMVFATSWKSGGGDLIKLTANDKKITAKGAANNEKLDNRDGGVVVVDGLLFGHFESIGLAGVDFSTLQPVWTAGRRGPERGAILWADGQLYYYNSEKGAVMLIEPAKKKPKKFADLVQGEFPLPEKSELKKVSGKNWTHPAIADGKLYLRDQELLFCYDVK